MVQEIYFQILIIVWLGVCAYLDAKTGEVSNWLTIPPLLGAAVYAVFNGQQAIYFFLAALGGLTILFFIHAMGGADVKILATLAGICPFAFWGALITQGIWGVVILLRKGRRSTFRAIPAISAGAIISFIYLFL